MIKNYLLIAWRNIARYKFISFINLFGLTTGLACCFLILTYILNELSYDRYNDKADRIYRVTRSFNNPETGNISLHLGSIAPPFAPLLLNDFNEIEKVTRLLDNSPAPMRYGDKMFNEQNVFVADDNLFDLFKVNVVKGNPETALTHPFSVMMTEDIAKKYFGSEDPMGKTIRMSGRLNLKVTGIFKPFPSNAHVHPQVMVSFNTLNDTTVYGAENLRTNWGNNAFLTYILLPENYAPERLEAGFPAFLDKHMNGGRYKPSQATSLFLQKLTDIHLRSHLDYEIEQNGDIRRVYVFAAIALFILLIACINYMNLSTARSTLRAREIGIRKAVGAQRKEIIVQFLTESLLVSWMAALLAFGIAWLLLPWLNKLSGQQLSIGSLLQWQVIIPVLLVPFAVGIIAGVYPALFMSSFQPVKVLKGLFRAGGANISFRKALVTVQFAISIILIICTAVVFRQMQYMHGKSLGFDKDHIITLPYNEELTGNFDAFRTALMNSSGIINVTRSSRIPTGRLLDANGASIMRNDSMAPVNADIKYVVADEEFISAYGIKAVAGRAFSKSFSLDTSAFMLNEAAVQALGFKTNEEAIGRNFGYGARRGKIIGVFNDFHFESLHQRIVPLVMLVPRDPGSYARISVKVEGATIPASLLHMESTWRKFLPETPYEYTFLDENFARLYKAEQLQQSIFTIFSILAIFIACLGLFGLSALTISQRIKEIGIRKVLGADVSTIVILLSKDFLKLVVIAAVIAFPVAWLAMSKWLEDFSYRTSIPWWVFPLAGVMAAVVALITISFQAIKAAIANPVKSLRTE